MPAEEVASPKQRVVLDRRSLLSGTGYLALAGFASGAGPRGDAATVETVHGKLRGMVAAGVRTFRGIRYAASTAGPNRFRRPQPVLPWTGDREALAFGPSAPQPGIANNPLMGWYYQAPASSEDCLFLNVFAPAESHRGRVPVMVWLHGGGWTQGAGTAPGWDGTTLARLGNVVVVTVNHRLNVFGHIRLDSADERFADSANVGVLDMIAALRWIRDNIAEFGGDPANVTIFGQSGGAAKVTALMGAPAAAGLFQKAVVQSCSGGLRLAEEDEAARLGWSLARSLGLASPTVGELQNVPMETLLRALGPVPGAFRPVVDGRTFQRHPFDPDAAATSAGIPLLVGNAATEVRAGLATNPRLLEISEEEAVARMARHGYLGAPNPRPIYDAYRAAYRGASPADLLLRTVTDYRYIRNTRRVAMLQADRPNTPVFAYVFNWRTPVMGGILQSPHAVEVPFVFGTARAASNFVGTGADHARLTRMMVATWSTFARLGAPGNRYLPKWPRFRPDQRNVMVLDLESAVRLDPGATARTALERLPYFEYSMPIS